MAIELPRGPRYGDTVVVRIDGISANGRGVGRLEAEVGPQRQPREYRVEVRKAMPGDVIEAVVESRKRQNLETRIGRILKPAGGRRMPRCRHFGPREEAGRGCGGCTLQALEYPRQLQSKLDLVRSLLKRDDVQDPIAAADEWFYRNKMELTFGDDRERRFALGLRPTGWHREVVDLQECFLMDPQMVPTAKAIQQWAEDKPLDWLIQLTLRTGKRTGQRLLELVTTHAEEVGGVPATEVIKGFTEVASCHAQSVWWTQERAVRGETTTRRNHHLDGTRGYLEELQLPGGRTLSLEVPLNAFFQPNPVTAERIIGVIVEYLGASRDLDLVDLYCGTGTMGLALSPFVKRVVGVELNEDAVVAARANALSNGLSNAQYLAGDCGKVLASPTFKALMREGRPDVVLVDPPRAGLQGRALELTASLGAPRLVYVSCGLKALARDLVGLKEHGYVVQKIQPVDLFPQTHHIENVVFLARAEG